MRRDSSSTARTEVPVTPLPKGAVLGLIRGRVREEIAETYPKFAVGAWGMSGRAGRRLAVAGLAEFG
jgi:hypothetical protein